MNNNIKINFTNTTVAFATTSHNHGNTANVNFIKGMRKSTDTVYARCKADIERRKKREYIIQNGSLNQAMNAFFGHI
jgi:hypothetical protein